mmetsp:Transcript_15532/g.51680  ORF Transcript_15532/g.51680 Transcript_15532/m.51680 type:complete len:463 (+) Transcript_15532:199-1587(+)
MRLRVTAGENRGAPAQRRPGVYNETKRARLNSTGDGRHWTEGTARHGETRDRPHSAGGRQKENARASLAEGLEGDGGDGGDRTRPHRNLCASAARHRLREGAGERRPDRASEHTLDCGAGAVIFRLGRRGGERAAGGELRAKHLAHDLLGAELEQLRLHLAHPCRRAADVKDVLCTRLGDRLGGDRRRRRPLAPVSVLAEKLLLAEERLELALERVRLGRLVDVHRQRNLATERARKVDHRRDADAGAEQDGGRRRVVERKDAVGRRQLDGVTDLERLVHVRRDHAARHLLGRALQVLCPRRRGGRVVARRGEAVPVRVHLDGEVLAGLEGEAGSERVHGLELEALDACRHVGDLGDGEVFQPPPPARPLLVLGVQRLLLVDADLCQEADGLAPRASHLWRERVPELRAEHMRNGPHQVVVHGEVVGRLDVERAVPVVDRVDGAARHEERRQVLDVGGVRAD